MISGVRRRLISPTVKGSRDVRPCDCRLRFQLGTPTGCAGWHRKKLSAEPAATLDHRGDKASPTYSSEVGVILLTFDAVRGCVSLFPLLMLFPNDVQTCVGGIKFHPSPATGCAGSYRKETSWKGPAAVRLSPRDPAPFCKRFRPFAALFDWRHRNDRSEWLSSRGPAT